MAVLKPVLSSVECLKGNDDPPITDFKPVHLYTATESHFHAFIGNPWHRYLEETPDAKKGPVVNFVRKLETCNSLSIAAQTHTAWTIGGGKSFLTAVYPWDPEESADPLSRATKALLGFINAHYVTSPEQKKRLDEAIGNAAIVLKEALGDKVDEMILVEWLFTSPESQGRGYASRLLRAVNAIADAENRAAYLGSSNVANNAFYNSHGFEEVAKVVVGVDNPTWNEPPVVYTYMVRQPKGVGVQKEIVL